MLHDYHFKLNEESKKKLKKISEDMGVSLSATIVVLFEKFLPFVEKNHFNSKEKDSKYKIIANPKEKRFSVHSYIPENLYRKMKHLHHDLNIFSMAQVVRKMIDLFIFGYLKYGLNKFIEVLNKINDIWKNKKEFYKNRKIIFMRQLFRESINFPSILINYGNNSQPYCMQYI
jgi:hypothetical protein